MERQIEYVREAIARAGEDQVEVRGALCLATADGLPWVGQLSIRGIIVDGPKPIAQLARRPGQLDRDAVDRLWRQLASAFPQA